MLVVAGGEQSWRGDLRARAGAAGAALVDSWEIRTALSEAEAKSWAACQAMAGPQGDKTVWVCAFSITSDGPLMALRWPSDGPPMTF